MSAWIQTYTGRRFDFSEPLVSMLSLLDIAHALAHTCRYGGHCDAFYSVAEHSIHVMERVVVRARELRYHELEVRRLARMALLHDAAEAYIGDFPSPLKRFIGAPIRTLEAEVMDIVAERFDLQPWERNHPLIHEVDLEVLMAEAPGLLTPRLDPEWSAGVEQKAAPGFRRWTWWGRLWTQRRFLKAAERLGIR